MRGRPLDLRGGLREIPRSVVEVEEARDDPATTGVQGEAMTTLDKRPNTALLVIGVQNGIVGGAYERDTVVANVCTLFPVVWVQHSSDNLPDR
jgi:hypothetical protein